MTKLRMHPDRGGDHWNATVINEAYAVLIDPAQRAAYDATRKSAGMGPETQSEAPEEPSTCRFCGAAHGLPGRPHDAAVCSTCNTPLAPVSHERLESGQRAVHRIVRRMALSYFTGWPAQGPYPAETRDLSLHGVRFVCRNSVMVGKLLKIECEALTALVRVLACAENDERDWRWLIRAELVTARFKRARGAFVSGRA
jgi:hypothetical protein